MEKYLEKILLIVRGRFEVYFKNSFRNRIRNIEYDFEK